jgi:hypothetical protein
MTSLALAEPFIASDAAVGFIRFLFIVFLRLSWSRRRASAWSLFSYRKRTSLRGNERETSSLKKNIIFNINKKICLNLPPKPPLEGDMHSGI